MIVVIERNDAMNVPRLPVKWCFAIILTNQLQLINNDSTPSVLWSLRLST